MLMKIKAKIYLFLMVAVLIWAACRKTDSQQTANNQTTPSVNETRFFGEHRSSNPQIEAISQWVKQQNDKKNFVTQTVKQIGYPRWDKALLQSTSSGTGLSHRGGTDSSFALFLVPFVRDSQNYVNASLVVKATPTDTTMGYICDWQYLNFGLTPPSDTVIGAKNIFHLFTLLDNSTFGHTSFKLSDPRLYSHEDSLAIASNSIPFDSAAVIYTLGNTGVSGRSGSYTITTCSNYAQCIAWTTRGFRVGANNGRGATSPGCLVSVSWTICTSILILEPGDLPTGGGTNTGGTGGGSGGSGAGSTPPPSPCPTATTGNRGSIYENCGPGWVPIVYTVPEFVPWDIDPGSNDDPNYYPGGVFYETADISQPGLTQKAKDHILKGEVYPDGRVGGFHYAGNLGITGRIRPNTSKTLVGPSQYRMYKAKVDIKKPDGSWGQKDKASTFFPPSWSEAKIIQEINNAYNNKTKDPPINGVPNNYWTGYSTEGIPIQMYVRPPNDPNGSIVTAFPKYN
jgi:Bacterial EndoU nuclease